MPRSAEAFQQIRTQRRAQILAAAVRVFARKGLGDTTVADLAASAGVSHGLLYRHFASKDAVFAALVEEALAHAALLVRTALERPGTPWDRLCWITTMMIPATPTAPRSDHALLVIHALTNEDVPPAVRVCATQQGRVIRDAVRRLIVDGQAAHQVVAGDPARLTSLYLACIQGLALRPVLADEPPEAFPDVETVLRILGAGQ